MPATAARLIKDGVPLLLVRRICGHVWQLPAVNDEVISDLNYYR
jgi:hypothetical protein